MAALLDVANRMGLEAAAVIMEQEYAAASALVNATASPIAFAAASALVNPAAIAIAIAFAIANAIADANLLGESANGNHTASRQLHRRAVHA